MINQARQRKPDPLYRTVCAACATPPGQSGLAVIRLSGERAAEAADQIFQPAGGRYPSVRSMPGYTCSYGRLLDPDTQELIDQVVLTRFAAPHSYTGEDVIEISCHGGTAVKKAILELLFQLGVSPAEPGEFTRRAFMNGKLDLVQAEAVMDLIQARADKASRAAAAQLGGALSRHMRELADQLYQIQAEIELILEFPEHDESQVPVHDLADRLEQLRQSVIRLADSYRQGRMLKEGLTVVIAGRPNAGKSSLLNALAGYERAIVTPVPGTTRDTVEEEVDIAGLPVRLVDTAGMRETADLIEQQGVDRARAAMEQADLVFWLISPPMEDLAKEKQAIEAAGRSHLIIIAGKEDLAESQHLRQALTDTFAGYPILTFSARRPHGLDTIRQAIRDYYEQSGSSQPDELLITNSRHQTCLLETADLLQQAHSALSQDLPLDIIASLLRSSAESIAALTGDSVSDSLVATIFARFCVGK